MYFPTSWKMRNFFNKYLGGGNLKEHLLKIQTKIKQQ